MVLLEKARNTFKRLFPSAAVIIFEVIGGVFGIFWAMVMIFSAFIGGAIGFGFAEHKVIPALGLDPGWLSWIVNGFLAFAGALVGVVVIEVLEIIVLILVLLAIAGVIAFFAGLFQWLKPTSSR